MLLPAVEAARRALRELETDDVPARLRKIAGYTSRRLPPPLAGRLIEQLDGGEWLREKTTEAWPEIDTTDPDPARSVSALFLLRPDGWEKLVAEHVEAHRLDEDSATVDELRRTIADLRVKLDESRAREQAARKRADAAATEARRRVSAARAGTGEARRAGLEETVRLRNELQSVAAERDGLRAQLEELSGRLDQARQELLRRRRTTEAETAPQTPSPWGARSPVDLARLVDELAAAARPTAAATTGGEPGAPERPILPAGVRPDSALAVDWMLGLPDPFTLVVDGYNLAYAMTGDAAPAGRQRVAEDLARLRRLSLAPMRCLLVFDSALLGGTSSRPDVGGIEVVFTEAGHSADDEVVALAGRTGPPVVVVSNDRQVRERSEAEGAVALWSDAVVEWLARR